MKKCSTEEERKEARRIYNKRYYENNREEILAQKKEYQEVVKESRQVYNKKYYADNKELRDANSKEYYKKTRMWLMGIKKQLGCQVCGLKDVRVLEFHHREPTTKLFSIGSGGRNTREDILKEMQKCDLLCSNCHSIAEWEYKYRGTK